MASSKKKQRGKYSGCRARPRMARSVSTEAFSELLNPVKDPERSFAINISELLQSYVKSFVEGSVNFNSAALMIQGSSSIYGKKVEYLHNLATKLYASLLKNKKEDGVKKDTKEKEKHTKESKFTDPFCSTEIKPGKNLSCLRKKFVSKNAASKKTSKKSDKKYTYIPVDLVPLDNENQKDENKNKSIDFFLNKCKATTSGWLLLPTTSPDLIPSEFSNPEYSFGNEIMDDDVCDDMDTHIPDSSPLDEGYPPSSGCTDTPTSVPSSQDPLSVPSSQATDEGLGSLPCTPLEGDSQPGTSLANAPTAGVSPTESPMDGIQGSDGLNHSPVGIENIPLEDGNVPLRPRRSMRQALKICQLQEAPNQEENTAAALEKEEVAAVKKAIQKKNTCNLPSKLKANNVKTLYPASEFCARTFFSMDRSYPKSLPYSFEVCSFRNHGKLFARFRDIQTKVLAINQRKKDQGTAADADENDDVEIGTEAMLADPVAHDDIVSVPLEAADIVIENNPTVPVSASDNENPLAEDDPMFAEQNDMALDSSNAGDKEDSFASAALQQCNLFRDTLAKYALNSDISVKVNAWEATMKPYLAEINQREEFDINLYGSRILNSFEDSNRKQTMTFRNFCKGKEKWEIHRYFMALLPLVNIGNVSIEPEQLDEDEEDILVTLLSRKMHHKELEEFGHNEGEHS